MLNDLLEGFCHRKLSVWVCGGSWIKQWHWQRHLFKAIIERAFSFQRLWCPGAVWKKRSHFKWRLVLTFPFKQHKLHRPNNPRGWGCHGPSETRPKVWCHRPEPLSDRPPFRSSGAILTQRTCCFLNQVLLTCFAPQAGGLLSTAIRNKRHVSRWLGQWCKVNPPSWYSDVHFVLF